MELTKLFALIGKVQNYAWGGFDFIPNLLGKENENKPEAEYWMGAHTNAPSTILTPDGEVSLNTYIESNKVEKLGSKIAADFGKLPFLFKVLDVHEMLSIQVHPTKKNAEIGFKLENEKGVPLNAFNRNYKDDNHKPEIMVALSDFWLLHGFLPKTQLKEVLSTVPEFSSLISVFETGGYKELYKKVMELSNEECNTLLSPLIDRIVPLYLEGKLEKSSSDYWAAKSAVSSTDSGIIDKGIFSVYFFNIVQANKGEAVFQDAGVPHSYLEGQIVELMANSDNVLRGGLTPKHIDVPELLKHVGFTETHPEILHGELQSDGLERIYKTVAPDFELSKIEIKKTDSYKSVSKTAVILIVVEGEIEISEGVTCLKLEKGSSAFLEANSKYQIRTNKKAIIYKATAP